MARVDRVFRKTSHSRRILQHYYSSSTANVSVERTLQTSQSLFPKPEISVPLRSGADFDFFNCSVVTVDTPASEFDNHWDAPSHLNVIRLLCVQPHVSPRTPYMPLGFTSYYTPNLPSTHSGSLAGAEDMLRSARLDKPGLDNSSTPVRQSVLWNHRGMWCILHAFGIRDSAAGRNALSPRDSNVHMAS